MDNKREQNGTPATLALLLAVIASAVFWRQIADSFTWWWNETTGIAGEFTVGELVVFVLGLIAALFVIVAALALLEKMLSFGRDLGRSFAKGWQSSDRT